MRFKTLHDMAWVAEGHDRPVEQYRELVDQGLSCAAFGPKDQCIAFLCGGMDDGELHIWELAVRREYQGKGIGRALIKMTAKQATDLGISAMTLTTLKNVPWNAPLYTHLGFMILQPPALSQRLRSLMDREARLGLPTECRCAMRLDLNPESRARGNRTV